MSKVLVAYFSATGTTAGAAKRLADAVKGDLFEIKPAIPYTASDLDWTDKHSRSTENRCQGPLNPFLSLPAHISLSF